jgi:hypothetical protein
MEIKANQKRWLFCPVFGRKTIIRIEDAIPTEKYPQPTFRNPKTSVVRHTLIVNYNHPVHLPGTPTIYAFPVK